MSLCALTQAARVGAGSPGEILNKLAQGQKNQGGTGWTKAFKGPICVFKMGGVGEALIIERERLRLSVGDTEAEQQVGRVTSGACAVWKEVVGV